MATITDDFMREMLAKTRTYTVVFLKKTAKLQEPDAGAVIWEHGRNNFSLRADGILAIVCPVADDSEWAGIALFNAPPEETAGVMDDDPAIKAGVLTYEVHPIRGFPGDSLPGRACRPVPPRRPRPAGTHHAALPRGNRRAGAAGMRPQRLIFRSASLCTRKAQS